MLLKYLRNTSPCVYYASGAEACYPGVECSFVHQHYQAQDGAAGVEQPRLQSLRPALLLVSRCTHHLLCLDMSTSRPVNVPLAKTISVIKGPECLERHRASV